MGSWHALARSRSGSRTRNRTYKQVERAIQPLTRPDLTDRGASS
jgi:hypothetical protein